MTRFVILGALLCGLLLGACGGPSSQTSAPPDAPVAQSQPQLDGSCTTADERVNIDGVEAVCRLDSAGMLAWTAAQMSGSDTPTIDGPCTTADERANIDGVEAVCMLNSAGSLAWQSANSGGTESGFDQVPDHAYDMVRVGMACDSPGNTVFMNELYVCKNGAWGYPVPGDLPIPSDGSKPDWYPSLDALSSQPEATCPYDLRPRHPHRSRLHRHQNP